MPNKHPSDFSHYAEVFETMMPEEVASGTFTYAMITIAVIMATWAFVFTKRISSDAASIITVVATMMGISTWLVWLCAWMHQWHPLITPLWKAE